MVWKETYSILDTVHFIGKTVESNEIDCKCAILIWKLLCTY